MDFYKYIDNLCGITVLLFGLIETYPILSKYFLGIKWMEEILVSCPDETSLCICDMEWEQFLKMAAEHSSLFSHIRREMEGNVTSYDESVLADLSNAPSREEQEHILLDFIKKILVTFTGGAEEEIDCYVPLVNYGVDSVGASLFKSQILHRFKIDIEVKCSFHVVKLIW